MATAFTAASARRCRLEDSAPASAHLEWAWCRPAGLLDAWLARPLHDSLAASRIVSSHSAADAFPSSEVSRPGFKRQPVACSL